MSIADLLQQSRDAHQRYRDAVPRRVPDGNTTVAVAGDPTAANLELTEANRLRLLAQAEDPQHRDPAWAAQPLTFPHDALLHYYAEQLSR